MYISEVNHHQTLNSAVADISAGFHFHRILSTQQKACIQLAFNTYLLNRWCMMNVIPLKWTNYFFPIWLLTSPKTERSGGQSSASSFRKRTVSYPFLLLRFLKLQKQWPPPRDPEPTECLSTKRSLLGCFLSENEPPGGLIKWPISCGTIGPLVAEGTEPLKEPVGWLPLNKSEVCLSASSTTHQPPLRTSFSCGSAAVATMVVTDKVAWCLVQAQK